MLSRGAVIARDGLISGGERKWAKIRLTAGFDPLRTSRIHTAL